MNEADLGPTLHAEDPTRVPRLIIDARTVVDGAVGCVSDFKISAPEGSCFSVGDIATLLV